MKKCKGCGAILQTENENKTGYVKDIKFDYCLNCFSLKHYNRPLEEISKVHFPEVDKDGLVVYLVSALHLNLLFKYDLKKFYPNQKVILLINKIDLLPKVVNFDAWVKQLKYEARRNHFEFLEVMPISALKGNYLEIFLETLLYYNYKKVYFIGFQNSGKSTLINRIASLAEQQEVALTSDFPGLTKENMTFDYKGLTIIDTPGVFEKGFISDYLQYNDFHKLIPNKRIRPKNFHLDSDQSIIVGGFLIVSFIKGAKTNFTFYVGNVNLHRTKYENVYSLFSIHKGSLFQPTVAEQYEKLFFKLDKKEKYLISLFDLGYLVLTGPVTLEIYAPKMANIIIKQGSYHGL